MHHPKFLDVAVAFFPPMLVLYLIRRYQHLSQTKLSKRQVRELIKTPQEPGADEKSRC